MGKSNLMKDTMGQFGDGLFRQNPTLVLLLGMCPTMAISTSLSDGFGMGLAATAVLICSNVAVSALRKLIPDKIRIAAYVVVIAGFVSLVEMILGAYVPSLYNSLGIFLPLIVVNCIILARAEAFAAKNTVFKSAVDGLTMGLGFTLAISTMSVIREVLGNGTLLGKQLIPPDVFPPIMFIAMPMGGFLTLGCIIAAMQWVMKRKKA